MKKIYGAWSQVAEVLVLEAGDFEHVIEYTDACILTHKIWTLDSAITEVSISSMRQLLHVSINICGDEQLL